jgi:hypothetical protein
MNIQELIKQLAGNNNYTDNSIYEAEVVSLDIGNREVIVRTIGGPEVVDINVRLMTTIGNGFLITPKIGSNVVIMVNPLINPFIIHYGEVESMFITSSQTIQLNGDDYKGLVKAVELTDRLNALEDALASLITKYNNHQHPASASGPITPTDRDEDNITTTNVEDIINEDITHGPKTP